MENNFIWIKNNLITKIYKDFPDKYILITSKNNDFDINNLILGNIVIYRYSPKKYIILGKVISTKNKKIVIEKIYSDFGCHSKSKMIEILSEYF